MKRSTTDPERLAALLDGRLDERQREEALARLASDEAGFEVFTEALAVTRELEAEDAHATRVLLRPRSKAWWQRRSLRALVIAAGLVSLVAIPWAVARTGAPAGDDPVRAMARLGSAERLPAGWDGTPWSARRSRGQAVTSQERSIRAGARLLDLEIAVRAGEMESTSRIATDVVALLDGVPAAAPVAAVYVTIHHRAAEPAARLERLLQRGRRSVATLLDGELVELGAWVEAARLAAALRDDGFFRADVSSRVMEAAARNPELPAVSRDAAERVLALIRSGARSSWPVLEGELTVLLQSLATG